MHRLAIETILNMIPTEVGWFEGSDYPLPIKSTLIGDQELDLNALRNDLVRSRELDVKNAVDYVLLASELYESGQDDRSRFFVTDRAEKSRFHGIH